MLSRISTSTKGFNESARSSVPMSPGAGMMSNMRTAVAVRESVKDLDPMDSAESA